MQNLKEPKKYLEAVKNMVAEEEMIDEKCAQEMFDRIHLSPELFEKAS